MDTNGSESGKQTHADILAAGISPLAVPNFVPQPVRGRIEERLIRLRRYPQRATFFVFPALFLTITVGAESSTPATTVTAMGTFVIPWVLGSVFGLNPLGDDGPALPVTILALPASTYVRSIAVPAVLFGLPLLTIWTIGGGLIAGLPFSTWAGFEGVGIVLTGFAAVFAPAVGLHIPQYNSMRVGGRSTLVLPSWFALAIETVVLGIMSAVGQIFVTQTFLVTVISQLLHTPSVLIQLLGIGIWLLAAAAITAEVYSNAVRVVSQLTIE